MFRTFKVNLHICKLTLKVRNTFWNTHAQAFQNVLGGVTTPQFKDASFGIIPFKDRRQAIHFRCLYMTVTLLQTVRYTSSSLFLFFSTGYNSDQLYPCNMLKNNTGHQMQTTNTGHQIHTDFSLQSGSFFGRMQQRQSLTFIPIPSFRFPF